MKQKENDVSYYTFICLCLFADPECTLWGCQRLDGTISFLSKIIYSWYYEPSYKSCSTMEQVFCNFLFGGDFCGSVIFLPVVSETGKLSFNMLKIYILIVFKKVFFFFLKVKACCLVLILLVCELQILLFLF